jgi:group I intron endonuclease
MVIYKIKNKINGKIYIGQTIQDLDKRIESHLKESRSNKTDRPFLNAIKKYGIENFEWEIIDEAKTLDELDEKEIYWIDNYNSLVPNGYNVLGGGQKRMIVSEEFCKRISNGLKNSEKWQKTLNSEEYKEKRRVKFIESSKGKKFTEEHKDKIRQKNAARLIEQNLNKSKSWILVDEKNNIIRIKNLQSFCEQNSLQIHFFANTLRKNRKLFERNMGYYCFLDTKQTDSEILEKCLEYDNLNFESVLLYDREKKLTMRILKHDLSKFCKENNLDRSNIDKVIKGKLKSYKGIELMITTRGSSNILPST